MIRTAVLIESRTLYAFLERNFNLVKRYFSWEIVFLFYSAINAMTIGYIGVNTPVGHRSQTVLYLLIGALLWGYLSLLFDEVANSISWERWEGTIEYTFMAPIRRLTHLLGMCLYAACYGIFRTVVVLAALTVFFHISLSSANLLTGVVVLVASSFSFMGLGLVAATLPLLSTERGVQATHIVQGVILLISGIYYPVTVLPHWVQTVSYLSPATYALEMARAALLQGASVAAIGGSLLKLFLIGLVLIPAGLAVFVTAERHAMRSGKLKRNG